MTARAFRFPAAMPQDPDEDFRRFLAAEAPYNPWPELVPTDDPHASSCPGLREPWSQPLVRLLYLPTTRPDQILTASRPRLIWWLAVLHERLHLTLDFTPAKEWARICLAHSYHNLSAFFEPHARWGSDLALNWERFQTWNAALVEVAERILLAEELIATAFSFGVAAKGFSGKPDAARRTALLVEVERAWVARQVAALDGVIDGLGIAFSRLYPSFRSLAERLAPQDQALSWTPTAVHPHQALARLAVFLEPLQISGELPDAVHCQPRCERLTECAPVIEDGPALLNWVEDEIPHEDLEAWLVAMAVAVNQRERVPPINDLWVLARGQRLGARLRHVAKRAAKAQDHYWHWPGPGNPWSHAILFPQNSDGRWHVQVGFADRYGSEYVSLIFLEGLRQQLNQGTGIRCPLFSPGGGCMCSQWLGAPFRDAMVRIARWALAGRFGNGDWRELPPACTR